MMPQETCWQKIDDDEEEAFEKARNEFDQILLAALDKAQGIRSLIVYSALLNSASNVFAIASVDCHNSDRHVEEHLEKDIDMFRQHVLNNIARIRKERRLH